MSLRVHDSTKRSGVSMKNQADRDCGDDRCHPKLPSLVETAIMQIAEAVQL
jgi:hypothetical protein